MKAPPWLRQWKQQKVKVQHSGSCKSQECVAEVTQGSDWTVACNTHDIAARRTRDQAGRNAAVEQILLHMPVRWAIRQGVAGSGWSATAVEKDV